ncbi:helicase domino [Bacillus rossius redtenbacheri]|uniref:helicase domino n=1 Tax=Bacillus rossius redtenbacheri TaxID=93214 RepID=UPI002FDEC8EE
MSDQQLGGGGRGTPRPPPPQHQAVSVAPGQAVRMQQVLTTRGQQFTLVNVPGLTQVMPAGATSLQQAGVARILNIGPSQRVSMVGHAPASNGVPDPAGRTVSLVAIGQPLVGALSSPPRQALLVRAPAPAHKRPREPQARPPPSDEVAALRRGCAEHRAMRADRARSDYAEKAAELIFLQAGGDLLNYLEWRQGSFSPQFLHLFRVHRLDPGDDDEDLTPLLKRARVAPSVPPAPVTPSIPATAAEPQPGAPEVNSVGRPSPADRRSAPASPTKRPAAAGSQEQMAEKARQEAHVLQRVSELQREGLWSERRLPRCQEPPRTKAHWDYLVEEMVWLAADFAQERKWKKAAAKKCARCVQKYFQEKAIQAQKAEKGQELRLKKIASIAAKEIKTFWANVEKLVEFKQQTRLEEKRKQALDQHLSFIVDQTEKYSTMLAASMNKGPSAAPSLQSSRRSSPTPQLQPLSASDEEFEPREGSTDDEETIARAEEEDEDGGEQPGPADELELLQQEGLAPLEDLELLRNLPSDYYRQDRRLQEDSSSPDDDEFVVPSDKGATDDEETIQEEEAKERHVDHRREIAELEAENELSIDELRAKYATDVPEPNDELPSNSESSSEEEDEADEQSGSGSEEEYLPGSVSKDAGGLSLKDLLDNSSESKDNEESRNEITDVAALAESIQPTGNTLSSTSVVTKIPFLLKHTLREYQHVGLDWLVTMYDRKLNGILADEMGLGKTIQTIALLAHLACEKGSWGPHLIIVPTSVMLNWEMEFKKWCPAFKILTYYGTQKERKMKRTGWTKPNAFHVCITSYKLVIQDHQSFRRKKWRYLILDEAQNIKNFKSQRWQLLLNFQTLRRLLLTGTPLQNNLMELWSLMHFLMPTVFQSHREFKEWFSNPVSGMIEGNAEYNENLIKRLHKVLRPFLLRRLKTEVEKQLPKKYEHVVMCRLSKRQRYLYDDFMSRAKTKETLASGNLLSVINVLMQLRKVCNHPNLFEVRPTVSPFQMEGIVLHTASLVYAALHYNPFKHVDLKALNLVFSHLEYELSAFAAHRAKRYYLGRRAMEQVDSSPEAPPVPRSRVNLNVKISSKQQEHQLSAVIRAYKLRPPPPPLPPAPTAEETSQTAPSGAVAQDRCSFQMMLSHPSGVQAIPVTGPGPGVVHPQQQQQQARKAGMLAMDGGGGGSPRNLGFAQLVCTPFGKQILLTVNPSTQSISSTSSLPGTTTVLTASGPRVTVLSKGVDGVVASAPAAVVNRLSTGLVASGHAPVRPVMRVPPLNVAVTTTSVATTTVTTTTTRTSAAVTQPVFTTAVHALRNNAVVRPVVVKKEALEEPRSVFYLPELERAEQQRRRAQLELRSAVNRRRVEPSPLYGADVVEAVRRAASPCSSWQRAGGLPGLALSPQQRVTQLRDLFSRFVLCVPAVTAPAPQLRVCHPPPSRLWEEQCCEERLRRELGPRMALLHPVASAMATQFPEPRLIQYDCGKLQVLDRLLRQLKTGHHRALIFTQMTKMLDVLEAFLNYHGHIYLRLDGTTRVDQRQMLMERFNADPRIFCFILSTRSGGIGVNLTGADTVIFYDSDWNPTMDAQAQDRCHRIGQTRDVHIYRLVSEMTVEENILKKANQKRLLGDLAIEGGNFTTAYFKSTTIQDLFNVDVAELDASRRMADVLERSNKRERRQKEEAQPGDGAVSQLLPSSPSEDKAALGALESALAAAEDEPDVRAARTAKAEAAAELAEFDESIPLEEGEGCAEPELSRAELEVQQLVEQLTPVEKYAMRFVEQTEAAWSAEQLAAAEAEIEQQKRDWEAGRLQALRQEEERLAAADEDDDQRNRITYSHVDAHNQVNTTPSRRGRGKAGQHRPPRPESLSSSSSSSSSSSEDSSGESVSTSRSESGGSGSGTESERKFAIRGARQRVLNNHGPDSPRTRSRGSVSINLWTLDVSPILPSARGAHGRRRKGRGPRASPGTSPVDDKDPSASRLVIRTRRSSTVGFTDGIKLVIKNDSSSEFLSKRPCRITRRSEGSTTKEDQSCKVWVSDKTSEQMPMWCPPTPPQGDNDVYIDHAVGFLYEQTTMSEAQLPPVYVKKELKRRHEVMLPLVEREGRRPIKVRHKEECAVAPRSLFDRSPSAIAKMRREMKLQKSRGVFRSPGPPLLKPAIALEPDSSPDWSILEDWVLLQTLQSVLELPLNLSLVPPGHAPNWELVADLVSGVARVSRTPKQCCNRYESVIMPREEGRLLLEGGPKRQKKTKGVYKLGAAHVKGHALRTAQLHAQDSNAGATQAASRRFEVMRAVAGHRTPTVKPCIPHPSVRNPKHAAVLSNDKIKFDSPIMPVDIISLRNERLAQEKQKTVQAVAAGLSADQQRLVVQRLQQQQLVAAAVAKAAAQTPQQAAVVVAVSSPSPALAVQEMVSGGQVRAVAGTPTVVSVSSLVSGQVQAAGQRLATASLVASQPQVVAAAGKGVVAGSGGKVLNPTQIHYYRQHALLKQQQSRMRDLKVIQAQGSAGQKVSVAVTTMAVASVTAAQGQQRTQLLKQGVGGKQAAIGRPMSEAEMALLLKRQQQLAAAQQQQKAQAQVPTQTGLTPAQILAQAGLQVQQAGSSGAAQVATLVKTVGSSQSVTIPVASMTLPGVKSPSQQHQLRQLALHQHLMQRKLPAQKVAQLAQVAGKGGLPTQLIVQSPKTLQGNVTMQQIHHLVKTVQQPHITHVSSGGATAGQVISHTMLAKAPQVSAATGRLISASAAQPGLKQIQLLQVVTATPGARSSMSNVTIDASGRAQVTPASTLASALAGIKVSPSVSTAQQHAILSQVSAALQAQTVTLRQSTQQSPLRIQTSAAGTPIMAVTMQQAPPPAPDQTQ